MIENLFLNSSNTREFFSFDSFEQSTTTGRDVRNLVGHTELVDTSYRVATTDKRECTVLGSLSNRFGNSFRTFCEVVHFEYTCRTIPKNSLCALNSSSKSLLGIRTYIKTFPSIRNCIGRTNLSISVVFEIIGSNT